MSSEPDLTALDFAKAGRSLDEWFAYLDTFGHVCCYCPRQTPPLPCCNAGHDEAMRSRAKFSDIVGETR